METLGSLELARLLLALTLLLAFAHIAGYLATRVRQPRVIGEIVGGLLLGPTVLGARACTIRCSPRRDLSPSCSTRCTSSASCC